MPGRRDKGSKKHQHANKVKEVQLSPKIDPHDLDVKVGHAIDFLCEDMKVKVTLKFRGRENAHTEIGFQVIAKFLTEIALFGHPDFDPKLAGRAINLMISPLPRAKRAKHPGHLDGAEASPVASSRPEVNHRASSLPVERPAKTEEPRPIDEFINNPFAQLEANR